VASLVMIHSTHTTRSNTRILVCKSISICGTKQGLLILGPPRWHTLAHKHVETWLTCLAASNATLIPPAPFAAANVTPSDTLLPWRASCKSAGTLRTWQVTRQQTRYFHGKLHASRHANSSANVMPARVNNAYFAAPTRASSAALSAVRERARPQMA